MPTLLQSIFGSKPNVPALPTVNLADQQQAAVRANQAILPGAEAMASEANRFNIGQINAMLENVMPGYQANLGTASTAISRMLQGELPMSDLAMQQNRSVSRAFGVGIGGSGGMGNLVARDIGRAQEQEVLAGLTSMENWMRTAASVYEPGMVNVSSMFVTPAQMYATANEQNIQQFQRNWMQSQISAMPDPVLAGINAEIMQLASSFLGGLGGGMGKGMGGGGGGSRGGSVKATDFQQDYSGINSALEAGGYEPIGADTPINTQFSGVF